MSKLAIFKIVFRTLIISILVIYFGCIILLHIPSVQQSLGRMVTDELEKVLDTDVEIGTIDLGILNRIIIQDVKVHDREGKQMIKVSRFSAKFSVSALLDGQIRIQSVQLFGAVINLNRKDAQSDPNFRFLIDAFASKKDDKKKSPIDLRINSVLIRRGELNYDVYSEPETPSKFNASHVGISNISANISLKALQKDSLNIQVRRMSFAEKSGFLFRRMKLKATANQHEGVLSELELTLPNGKLSIDSLSAQYSNLFEKSDSSFLSYGGKLVAKIVPADLAAFAPTLKHFKDSVFLRIEFNNNDMVHSIHNLRIYSPNREVVLAANGSFLPASGNSPAYIQTKIRQAEVTQAGFNWLFRNLTGDPSVPPILQRIGVGLLNAELSGTPYHLYTRMNLTTALGSIKGNGSMLKDTITEKRSFTGQLYSKSLQLGKLLSDNKFGNTSFNLDFKGLNYHNKSLKSYIKGTVSEFEYNNYKYHNILLDGNFKPGDFSGRIDLQDENAKVSLDGSFSTSGKTPIFDLQAVVKDFCPDKLFLTEKYPDTKFSGNLLAKFTGNHIDNIEGIINIDSLQSIAPDEEYTYTLPHFHVMARPFGDGKEITIDSPEIEGKIYGKYSYESVISSIHKIVTNYIPSLWPGKIRETKQTNIFSFNFNIDKTEALKRIFRIPVDLQIPGAIQGWFDDQRARLYLNANLPLITVNNKRYESIHLLLENPQNALSCKARGNIMMNKGSMINLSLNTVALSDSLHTTLFWGNNTNVTYSGKVVASTNFKRSEDKRKLLTDIEFHPGHFILNDTVWNIHPSKVLVRPDSIDIQNIHIEHQNQYVRINGRLGNKETDSCKVNLRDINILYLLDMIQFEAVKFEGNASGTINLAKVLKGPQLDANLDVKNFCMNDALLGRAHIKGGLDNENGRILLDADIPEDSTNYTKIKGYVSPKEKGLDLHIEAGGTNLAILAPFMEGIFRDVSGRVRGDIRLYGPFKQLDLEGYAKANLGLTIDALNTRFYAQSDSVVIKSGDFQFNQVHLTDIYGNSGMVNGYLRHNKFKNMTYNFRIDAKDMLIFSTDEETPDYPFYGDIFATGNTVIQGNPQNGLSVDAHLRAEDKTSFVYVLGAAAQATSNQFITFVDRTPKRAHADVKTELYHYLNKKEVEETNEDPMDIHLNLQIEPTPLAEMRVLMDPIAGDYISAKGNGNLRVNFFNKGDFQMFGNYNISEGIYKISMQNVIRKDFTLRPGGSVSFNGNPRAANLNLQAVHTVPSASLNDLIPDATSSRGNVRVNCIVNLSGNLTSPNMTFDLELPTVNEEDQQLVRSLTSTPEQMTTQIIYLLGVGKFYAFDYANQANQSNATSSLAFNTLSGQLNNMLSQVIDNQNWNVGTNLTTGQNGWTDVEAEAILSGRLLNNRLIINGNFGYRENTLQNSNFVGDFEAIWLLTKNGDFRLRGYNMTNDRYFTKSTMTTQGVGFIYKKDFTRWGEVLDWLTNFKRHRREKLRAKKTKEEEKNVDKKSQTQNK